MKKHGSRKLVPRWELWKLAREKEGKYDVETQHVVHKIEPRNTKGKLLYKENRYAQNTSSINGRFSMLIS